jgi:hypothetical protein
VFLGVIKAFYIQDFSIIIMPKKCIICDDAAEFCVKGSSECYCKVCAQDQFGDLNLLVAVEEQAKGIKSKVDQILEEDDDS